MPAMPAGQQPDWPDRGRLSAVTSELARLPPLVFAAECELLTERLAAVTRGEAFVLQGGDCAETFDGATAEAVRAKLQTLLQMALVLTYGASVPVVKIARMAGQFAKPRSRPTETRDGVALPAYRGNAVNGFEFTAAARTPDPGRLLRAYHCSAATLNLCRAFTTGGYADLNQAHGWNQDFVRESPSGQHYERLADEIDRALAFMRACGANPAELRSVELYTSHEALLLDYEQSLTRSDPDTRRRYDASAHFLWIGERTRDLSGAHLEFARSIAQPHRGQAGSFRHPRGSPRARGGAQPGRGTWAADVYQPDGRRPGSRSASAADPGRLPGPGRRSPGSATRCTATPSRLPAVTRRGGSNDVLAEVHGFFDVHRMLGTHPGGIHIEFTGDNVTECVGGSHQIAEGDLYQRYETACDPRLNRSQSLDLAFTVAESYRTSPAAARR